MLLVLATALGGAMLTIAELELQVAENARRGAVAAHAARAGARAVARWFDDPHG
ncbi:MAG: hypothetical protein GWN73_18720, partial [Actinobacteria bacterium]|nr:hypothetical protein [Actinomycetota bacterium]NIS32317.1 hypothetical protein [Actinomycetota bacterium]NIU67347.1 hypothetical protein [Actinomycetota bacterium]NIW29126.1 hypothetical protein [Actinomycetota bacterium]